MANYRLVVRYPEDGQRHSPLKSETLFTGPNKADLRAAIDAYHATERKPWAETFYYLGKRRLYAYEL